MLEKDIENLIAAYPEEFFPGEGFKLLGQQITIEGRRLDILFEDKHGRQVLSKSREAFCQETHQVKLLSIMG